MDTELCGIDQANVREAFIHGRINLTNANPIKIATILRIAVTKNDTKYAMAILDQMPDILQHDNGGGKLLWEAMENGNEILARKLIFAGADLNYRSRNGKNILHCFMCKYETLVSLMIEHGADINITDSSNNTILYTAVKERLISIVETFGKLDINYKDEERILKEAVSSSDYSSYMLPSLVKSADIARKKARARLVLPFYLKLRTKDQVDINLVKILIEAALAPQHANADVVEILKTVIAFKEHTKTVRLLLDYVHTLNGKLEAVASLLCKASRNSQSTMSILLIHKGANISYPNEDGEYPLHSACGNQSLQNIHLLLSLGADLMVIDKNGRTPFLCLPTDSFREQHRLVLRHLAILKSKNVDLNPNDLEMINKHSRMRIYYEECLIELWNMKRTRIYGDTSFFCFFDKTLEELSPLSRHVNFLKTYYLNQKEGVVSFPRYSMHIHHIFKMAVDRKNILNARAKIYEEAAMTSPPYGRISQVVQDITELDNFERKYYFRLYEVINNTKE